MVRTFLMSFFRDERGNAIVIMAAALFIMVVAVGAAIDTSRISASQSRLAGALDAAGLAAGVALSPGGSCSDATTTSSDANMNACLSKVANNYFNANYPAGYMDTSTITITAGLVNNDNQIQLTAKTNQTPGFMSIMGVNSVSVNVYTLINLPPPPQCAAVAASTTPPSANLCIVGTATAVTGDQYKSIWTWNCNGSAGRTASCYADLLGSCSSPPAASSTPPVPSSYTSLPTNMCASGNPVFVFTGYNDGIDEQWGWTCNGTNNNNSSVCVSDLKGECNVTTENATATTAAPSGTLPLNLCADNSTSTPTNAGNPTTVIAAINNNRPNWAWTCNGTNNNNATCQSSVQAQCGTAQNVSTVNTPSGSSLCASPDTNSGVGGGGTSAWSWSCYGTNTNDDTTCGAPLTGTCGAITSGAGACGTGTSGGVTNSTPTDYWYCNGSAATSSGGGSIDTGTQSAKCTGNDGVCGSTANSCSSTGSTATPTTTGCPTGATCWTCSAANAAGEPSGLCSAAQSNTGSAKCGNINMTAYDIDTACDQTNMQADFTTVLNTAKTDVTTADGTTAKATADPTIANLNHLLSATPGILTLEGCYNGTGTSCSYGGISFTGTCSCSGTLCSSIYTLNDSNGDCTAPTCPTTLTAEPAGTKVTATCPTGELASSVSGTGPWTWTCSIGDATSPTCTVEVTAVVTTPPVTTPPVCSALPNNNQGNILIYEAGSVIGTYGTLNSTELAGLIKNYSKQNVCGTSHTDADKLCGSLDVNFAYSPYVKGAHVCNYICSNEECPK